MANREMVIDGNKVIVNEAREVLQAEAGFWENWPVYWKQGRLARIDHGPCTYGAQTLLVLANDREWPLIKAIMGEHLGVTL